MHVVLSTSQAHHDFNYGASQLMQADFDLDEYGSVIVDMICRKVRSNRDAFEVYLNETTAFYQQGRVGRDVEHFGSIFKALWTTCYNEILHTGLLQEQASFEFDKWYNGDLILEVTLL